MSKDETYPCDDCIYQDRPERIFREACDGCHPNGYPYYTKKRQRGPVTDKLISCPYCGKNPEPCGTNWVMCRSKDCRNRASIYTPKQWNRRHACEDWEFVCNTCNHKCGIELIESEVEE